MNFDRIIYSDYYKEQRLSIDKLDIQKLEQAIEVHGYRGASKKKHNGVVPIRPTDNELIKSYKKRVSVEHFDTNLDNLSACKVVAHVPNGNRLV